MFNIKIQHPTEKSRTIEFFNTTVHNLIKSTIPLTFYNGGFGIYDYEIKCSDIKYIKAI